jgi:hypothetical protein
VGSCWPAPKHAKERARGRHGGEQSAVRPVPETTRVGAGQCSPALKLGLPRMVAHPFPLENNKIKNLPAFESKGLFSVLCSYSMIHKLSETRKWVDLKIMGRVSMPIVFCYNCILMHWYSSYCEIVVPIDYT